MCYTNQTDQQYCVACMHLYVGCSGRQKSNKQSGEHRHINMSRLILRHYTSPLDVTFFMNTEH